MGLEFARPWFLLLIPVALFIAWWGWLTPTRRLGAARLSHFSRVSLYTARFTSGQRRPSGQHTAATGLRLLIMLMLILAIAGASWRFTARRQSVVFAVDVSASVQGRDEAVTEFLRQAIQGAGHDDQAAVVAMGETSMVDAPLGPGLTPAPVLSDPGRDFTNLAEGLRLAAGLLPAGTRPRVVLVSDGHENAGDAVAQAQALASRGIRVDVVPLEAKRGPEVLVSEVRVPPYAFTGEEVPVTAAVRTTAETTARVRLYTGSAQVAEKQVQLLPGLNQVSFKVPAGDRGFQTYRVEVEAQADTRVENNAGSGVTRVSGTPAVLLVRSDPEDAAAVRAALTQLGVRVEEREPEVMPASAEDLRTFAAVILANVPAHRLRESVMEQLESYVRDSGGGLLMIGGEESFGLGTYHGTPVEQALPVYMDIKGRGEIPSLGLVIAMDKSGSMGFLPRYGVPVKMELAKEAAIRTLDILTDQDLFGVVAFDSRAGWVVEPSPVVNRAALQDAIGRIYPGGGTNIYPGLELAHDGLKGVLVKSKHVILLTDGVSAFGGNYEQLTREMRDAGITMSTVAVGNDADVFLLQQLARWGRGRFYYTEDGDNIPTIFAKETVLATRSYVVEKAFSPAAAAASPLLRGLGSVPTLFGYVATRAKEAAEVALISDEQDPVLAHWQYGLGRSVAWTPDVKGRWARAWLGTPELQQLLSNAISWMMRPEQQGDMQVTARTGAGTVSLQVDAPIEQGSTRATKARITGPDQDSRDVALQAVAPGQYMTELTARAPGAYLVQVDQQGADGTTQQSLASFVMPYSPEYSVVGVNWQRLQQIATAGGGQVLTDPGLAFANNLPTVQGRVEMWSWLVTLAALLWPLDVALRRLVIRPEAVRSWLALAIARLLARRQAMRNLAVEELRTRRAARRQADVARANGAMPDLPVQAAPAPAGGVAPVDGAPADSAPAARSADPGAVRSAAAAASTAAHAATPSRASTTPPSVPAAAQAPRTQGAASSTAGPDDKTPATASHASRLLAAKRRRQEERQAG